MTWGGVPCDTEWIRNSNLFKDNLKRFDAGEWKFLEKEVWKDIEGWEGHYQVSNHGRVKSIERIILNGGRKQLYQSIYFKFCISKAGYKQAVFRNQGTRVSIYVHRLVALAFVPNHDNKREVNHKDGNKLNTRASNMEWCSSKENTLHAFKTGLRCN